MPNDDFIAGMMVGVLCTAWTFAILANALWRRRHAETMAVYDMARDLLSERFDLFREVHHKAMTTLRDAAEEVE